MAICLGKRLCIGNMACLSGMKYGYAELGKISEGKSIYAKRA
jgi:hypothetical protein